MIGRWGNERHRTCHVLSHFLIFLLLLLGVFASQAQNTPIGQWETHFSYLSAHQLAQTEHRIFCASYNGLFSVTNEGGDPKTYGKQEGLSDTGISAMAYDPESHSILLVYRSGIIDQMLLDENSEPEHFISWTVLQSASDLPAQKDISKVLYKDGYAYLATNFGIVVLDTKLHQILETYRYIGTNGAEVQVRDISFTRDSIYALTSKGLIVSSMLPTVNRQYFASWKAVPFSSAMTAIASHNDTLYGGFSGLGIHTLVDGSWKLVHPTTSTYYSFTNTERGILATIDTKLVSITSSGEVNTISNPLISAPKNSLILEPGHLWIADSRNGLVGNTGNGFAQYSPITQDTTNTPAQDSSFVDLNGLSWTRLPSYLSGGILVKNVATGKERILNTSQNNGGLPSSAINSLALDQEGYIWFASDKGVGYIIPDEVLSGGSVNAVLPIYGQHKLFVNEKCTAVTVEAGDRKWIGTRNGLYQFSADGTELNNHFTTDNSPLPSNHISSLYYEPNTGLLFIDSPNGLSSYRTNSSTPSQILSNITIFPNPVRPGYSGIVGFKGLTTQSTVKITQLSGRLVYQTRSEGGLATWNLNDYTGRRAQGGIYMVYVISQDGTHKVAGKLAILE